MRDLMSAKRTVRTSGQGTPTGATHNPRFKSSTEARGRGEKCQRGDPFRWRRLAFRAGGTSDLSPAPSTMSRGEDVQQAPSSRKHRAQS